MDAVTLLFGLGMLVVGAVLGATAGRAVAGAGRSAERAALQAALDAERRLAVERSAALQSAQQHSAEQFGLASAEALRGAAHDVVELAEQRLDARLRHGALQVERLVGPLSDTLGKVESQLVDTERRGAASAAAVLREMELVRATSEHLRETSGALLTALRKPQARGQWGEMQLRRVVELAGMVERCDFDVQLSVATATGTVRPDLVVRLTGGRTVVVDAKAPLSACLEAAEMPDGPDRAERLAAHARHLRGHVEALAAKEYWAAFPRAPEFVVLFVPADGVLAAALDADPTLLEHAFRLRVHILTPTTLISALRTIAVEWQHAALTDSAREVVDVGRELHRRLGAYARHVDKLGRALGSVVEQYNASLGSLDRSVVTASRRLAELHVADEAVQTPPPRDELLRRLSSPELLETASGGEVVALARPAGGAEGGRAPP